MVDSFRFWTEHLPTSTACCLFVFFHLEMFPFWVVMFVAFLVILNFFPFDLENRKFLWVVWKSRGSATTRASHQGRSRGSRAMWLELGHVVQNALLSMATKPITMATGTVTMATTAWMVTMAKLRWRNPRWRNPRWRNPRWRTRKS